MGSPGAHAPSRLGRYELLARLATGGMGEIFLARLEGAAGFEKLFVVKRILPHLADDARFRGMLISEAQIASKMSHANICQVYELGETDGQLYIVMEYLEGLTMLPLLRRSSKENTPLDFGFIGSVIQQASDGLHYAHELRDRDGESMGIVHRDVTPSNIFLTDSGVAKILDFGIAKVKDASARTQTGTVKGKYAYMAPEQLRGAAVDRRADVFALGVATYEMLALRRLFQRKTDYLTFRAVMEQPIADVRRYRPDVPDAVAAAVNRALDRDPDQRYATARMFGAAVLDGLGRRPWTQGEVSDFLKACFSDELHKRTSEVAHVIHRRPGGASPGRTTMPLIQDEPFDDDTDDEFPSVESTPPDAPPLETLRRPASTDALPPQPKRSLVWPLVAVAAVGVAGAALVLVWKQMQNQGPPPVVNITASPASPEPERIAVVTPDAAAIEEPKPRPRPSKKSPYDVAIQQQRSKLNACATEHGAPAGQARVVVEIATNGRAKTVSLKPLDLDTKPLGACIKNVLSLAAFPAAREEMKVEFALKPN